MVLSKNHVLGMLLLLLVAAPEAFAQTQDYCFSGENGNISRFVQVFRDPDRVTTLEEVLARPGEFEPSGMDRMDFGTSADRFWFKFTINNCTTDTQNLLFLTNVVRFGLFKAYQLTPTGPELLLDTTVPGATLQALRDHSVISYRLNLLSGSTNTYLMQFEAANNASLPFSVADELTHVQERKSRERTVAAILAALAAMILINAILFFFTRMEVYGLYVAVQGMMWLYILHIAGWSALYLWGDGPFDKSATGLLAASITMIIPLFTRVFYREVLADRPLIRNLLVFMALGNFAYLVLKLANFFIDFSPGPVLNNFGYLFGHLGMFMAVGVSGWYTFKLRGIRSLQTWSSFFFTLAWLLVAGNVILMGLRSMSVLKMTPNALLEFGYISLTESLVLAMSLALRVRLMYLDRERAIWDRMNTERSAEAVGRMILSVGHDSRQLLSAMASYCDLLMDKVTAPQGTKLVGDMKRLANLLSDVMTNAIEGGEPGRLTRDRVQDSEFTLDRAFPPLELIYKTLAREHEVMVTYRANSGRVFCDRVLLIRILGNLLSNAIKHSGSRRVLVTARMRNDHVLLQVRDSGLGIPSSVIRSVQKERMSPRKDGRSEDLGIGLKGAYDMATAMGASLEINSETGKGSCVSLIIPRIAGH